MIDTVRFTPCSYTLPRFGACPQAAVWVIDDSLGGTVLSCSWHVGALLSEEGENLVYRVQLPTSGVEVNNDDVRTAVEAPRC